MKSIKRFKYVRAWGDQVFKEQWSKAHKDSVVVASVMGWSFNNFWGNKGKKAYAPDPYTSPVHLISVSGYGDKGAKDTGVVFRINVGDFHSAFYAINPYLNFQNVPPPIDVVVTVICYDDDIKIKEGSSYEVGKIQSKADFTFGGIPVYEAKP